MEKIAIGPGYPAGTIDLNRSATDNVQALAKAKGVKPAEIIACVLDRPRHDKLIADSLGIGCRHMLIPDGPVAAVLATRPPDPTIAINMGQGGAPEGVLPAQDRPCAGRQLPAALVFRHD